MEGIGREGGREVERESERECEREQGEEGNLKAGERDTCSEGGRGTIPVGYQTSQTVVVLLVVFAGLSPILEESNLS